MKSIAVFTSGGDAPGMNAGVRAVVRNALYLGIDIYGIKYGYNGMIEGDIYKMKSYSVSNIIQRGGTILKSARSKEFLTPEGRKKAYEQLSKRGIQGLVAIGGDGTFTGANVFYEEFGIPVVGIPGTIDNDLYGSDYTVGFDTAVNTALHSIDLIRDTANSHDRVFFIEVMGRQSGYIAVQCGIGGGAEMVMVPETSTTIKDVIERLKKDRDKDKTSSIIIVAEGDIQGNAHEIASKVSKELPELDIRVSTLGHVQRGGSPTAFDRILASRLGMAAVEGLVNGKKGVMVGIIDDKIHYTSFKLAISKSKPINDDLMRMIEVLSS
ncbi:MAG: 6-phosphofructokinase [Flammeovirgaceae bacterium]|jgi:6-phosphofructokinase 1|nr:6-phosphofructokinase [Flammeovirgaceae bacterium]|tara:strand:+ start:20835 stop:21806 length:972 start_codon:yes stop_codon:yes gene_type:complete